MYLLYLFCLFPIAIGFILTLLNKKVVLQEWLIGSGCAFILAGGMHYYAYSSQVGDYETWSGKIVSATFFPAWKEYYEYAVYRTERRYTGRDNKGNAQYTTVRVFDHWEGTTRWHQEHWNAYSNINTSYDIPRFHYEKLVTAFGNKTNVIGNRRTGEHNSRMISGDPYDYPTYLYDGLYVEPVTAVKYFVNRIKASPSVFNFIDIPNNVPVFEYPSNKSPWVSDRVIGTAKDVITIRLWDEMCARLGPHKRVNVIIIGFASADSFIAEQQRSKWLGGKKNDLVICYGPAWCKVFGWSNSDICKRNIESLILKYSVNDNIIPHIEKEIIDNYSKREFTEDFAYLSVEPTGNQWLTFFILMILSQTGLYYTFHHTTKF